MTALLLAAITLILALWIVVPAPTYFLLTFGVGAPEVSHWLMVASLVAIGLAIPDLRAGSGASLLATAMSLAALALALRPWVAMPGTVRRFAREMHSAFGDDTTGLASPGGQAFRTRPISVRDLVLGVQRDSVPMTRGVTIAMRDGVQLTMDVHRPPTPGPHPILIQIYGGAWQRGDPSRNADFAQWIAARGYAVFAIDYRHAPQARWPAQLDDVRLALTWIRDQASEYGGDTSRVAIIGRSAGAHLALLAAYTPGPLTVRGVVGYYAPVDLADAYENPPSPDPMDIRDVERKLIGGTPQQFADAYREASPITYATRRQPPTLLITGARDHVVEARYSARLRDRLMGTRTPVALLEIPWAEHAFDAVFNGPSSQLALYHTERFLAWAVSWNRGA